MSALPSIHETVASPHGADQAGALYEAYSERILGYCIRRLPSREEAEDAVQHTFLNAFRGLRRGVVPRSDGAWLFKIAENVCRERRRSAWRRSRVETAQDLDGVADIAATAPRVHDELAGLADALAELTPNQQRAILLREWQGLSYREIAVQLELTEAAVETLLFRARRSLADKLDHSRGSRSGRGWGKSLAGGTAAKVAATAVVVGGIIVALPALRPHQPGQVAAARGSRPVAAVPLVAPPASRPHPAAHARSSRPTGHVRGTVPQTRPKRTSSSPSRPAAAPSHAGATTRARAPKRRRHTTPAQQPATAPALTAPDAAPLEAPSP